MKKKWRLYLFWYCFLGIFSETLSISAYFIKEKNIKLALILSIIGTIIFFKQIYNIIKLLK